MARCNQQQIKRVNCLFFQVFYLWKTIKSKNLVVLILNYLPDIGPFYLRCFFRYKVLRYRPTAILFIHPELLQLARSSIIIAKFLKVWLLFQNFDHFVYLLIPLEFEAKEEVAIVAAVDAILAIDLSIQIWCRLISEIAGALLDLVQSFLSIEIIQYVISLCLMVNWINNCSCDTRQVATTNKYRPEQVTVFRILS